MLLKKATTTPGSGKINQKPFALNEKGAMLSR